MSPDLTLERITVTLITSHTYTVTVVVRNQGGAVDAETDFLVNTALTDDVNSPTMVCRVQGIQMGAGQSVICAGPHTFSPGPNTVWLWIDPDNDIAEGDETNNTLDAGVMVREVR